MGELGRRDLFRILGTVGAAVGAEACADIVPHSQPVSRPGPQKTLTTVCGACPAGCGISVRLVGDNAVKIAGIEGHPVNDGGLCPRGVAEIQELYHPERVKTPIVVAKDRASGAFTSTSWTDALAKVTSELKGAVVIGVGRVTALERLLVERLAAKTGAQLVSVGLKSSSSPNRGHQIFFGASAVRADLPKADFVLSIGSDWLQTWPSAVEAQRTYAALRDGQPPTVFAVADARLSTTASRADHWIPIAPGDQAYFALALARAVLDADGSRASRLPEVALLVKDDVYALDKAASRCGTPKRVLAKLVEKLQSARHPVVMVDGSADLPTQVAATALQLFVDNGQPGLVARAELPPPASLSAPSIQWADSPRPTPSPAAVLLIKANPVYLEPRSAWSEVLHTARFVASVTSHLDESAQRANVILPISTALESRQLVWGLTLGGEPFVSAGPAAVKPLYDTLEATDVLAQLVRAVDPASPWKHADDLYADVTQAYGVSKQLETGGVVRPQVPPSPTLTVLPSASAKAAELLAPVTVAANAARADALDLVVYAPLAFAGGLGAHLPYLHGITGAGGREAWRTIVEIHPETAKRLGIADRADVLVETGDASLRGTAFVRQGIRPDTVAIPAGLGRHGLGRWADGWGDNPLALTSPGATVAVTLRRA